MSWKLSGSSRPPYYWLLLAINKLDNSQLFSFIDFHWLLSAININLRLMSIVIDYARITVATMRNSLLCSIYVLKHSSQEYKNYRYQFSCITITYRIHAGHRKWKRDRDRFEQTCDFWVTSGSCGFSLNSNRKTNISVKTDKSLKHNGVKDAFEKHVKLQVTKVNYFISINIA